MKVKQIQKQVEKKKRGRKFGIRKENDKVLNVLKNIARKHGGTVKPEDVVEEARNKNHPLHDKFEWDDTRAGEQFRLVQARQLINATVIFQDVKGGTTTVRAFVSLPQDRGKEGYRPLTVVLSDEEFTRQLLESALGELESFQRKYSKLKELEIVFKASEKLRRKFSNK